MTKTKQKPKSKTAAPAAETRRFQMHPRLLLDVIQRQAGSLTKAILEGVMNSVDAGATACTVQVAPTWVTIEDNGQGMTDRAVIEKFFETFGQPHEEAERKTYGTFRMGRGQMFAFGANTWRTGPFEMKVDVQAQGLDYQLLTHPGEAAGCRIEIALYRELRPSEVADTVRTLKEWVKYAPGIVTVNGEQANVDPEKEKWDHVTDLAYVRLQRTGGVLSVYNLGVHTLDLPAYRLGSGGTVVSRRQLKVNFARNDIQSDCPVWQTVLPFLREKTDEKVVRRATLTDAERQRLADRLVQGEAVPDAHKLKLFTTVAGRQCSAREVEDKAHEYGGRLTVCERGNLIGDKLHQRKAAFVLAGETLERFGLRAAELPAWVNKLSIPPRWPSHKPAYTLVPFEELAATVNEQFDVLPDDELTVAEAAWLDLARRLAGGLPGSRRIVVGESDAANGWTDGRTYVALGRAYLRELSFDLCGVTGLLTLLCHEWAHDGPDTGTHEHGPEFYQGYHDLTRDTLPPLVATALARLPAALKAAGKAVPRETLRAADQLAAARQAAARLYHQLAGQENAGKEVAADAR